MQSFRQWFDEASLVEMSFHVSMFTLKDFSDGPAHGAAQCSSQLRLLISGSVCCYGSVYVLDLWKASLLRNQLFRSHLKVNGTFT